MQKEVSVIISARNEMPNIVHTVHSIINDLETFLTPEQWEIIIVDNGSDDKDSYQYLAERGLYFNRNVRIHHDPLMGNVSARNKGAKISKGKKIFFSDAHMSFRVGSFQAMMKAIDESGGIVHPAVEWMGGYEPSEPSYQYSVKLGEKLWGTWNRQIVTKDDWFYIPMSGHCCLGMDRQQFLDFGGYNNYFRCYGGGEFYLDTKWYMLGSCSVVEPRAKIYHLSAGRGYSYNYDDLIHNMMLLAYALGGDGWGERLYLRYMGKNGVNVNVLNKLHDQAKREAVLDDTKSKALLTMDDVITQKPWDVKNIEKHGKSNSALVIFDETWTNSLTGTAREMYDNSPLQKELKQKIDTIWKDNVYGE